MTRNGKRKRPTTHTHTHTHTRARTHAHARTHTEVIHIIHIDRLIVSFILSIVLQRGRHKRYPFKMEIRDSDLETQFVRFTAGQSRDCFQCFD